jgi:hypothetical protein
MSSKINIKYIVRYVPIPTTLPYLIFFNKPRERTKIKIYELNKIYAKMEVNYCHYRLEVYSKFSMNNDVGFGVLCFYNGLT